MGPLLAFTPVMWSTARCCSDSFMCVSLGLKKSGDFLLSEGHEYPLRPSVTELGSIIEGRPGPAQHSRTPGFRLSVYVFMGDFSKTIN